jgi:hypothetical protein
MLGRATIDDGEMKGDGVGDVLSTVKGGPGYVGGVKFGGWLGGGSRGQILHQT